MTGGADTAACSGGVSGAAVTAALTARPIISRCEEPSERKMLCRTQEGRAIREKGEAKPHTTTQEGAIRERERG